MNLKTQNTMKKAMDAISRHDANGFAALYAPDATAYDPQYPKPLKGREAVKEDIEDFFTAFPDIKAKVVSILSSGDLVASEVVMSGTHKGPLAGPTGTIPPTNRSVNIHIGRFIRVNKQGLITECNRYYDLAGLLQQLGLM